MIEKIPIENSYAVFGRDEYTYQCVLDDFKNAKFIGIMTFNISPKKDSILLESLKVACTNGSNATIITNIPKRFQTYFRTNYAVAAKEMIELYKKQLDPRQYEMRLTPYFTFYNHAKVIMTENIAYWGSGNFSDESSGNLEGGVISTDREIIEYLRDYLFEQIKEKSVPYYKHNFAAAIVNLDSLIPGCKAAREDLLEAAFVSWADYDTNFQEQLIYRKTDSGLSVEFLQGFIKFFSKFDDALEVIEEIVIEYNDIEEPPETIGILEQLFNDYNETYHCFYEDIITLFEELEQIAKFDVSAETCRLLDNDYGMYAHDESFEYYVQISADQISEMYREVIEGSEENVCDALENLESMISYFENLKQSLYQLLEIDSRIDNTGIR